MSKKNKPDPATLKITSAVRELGPEIDDLHGYIHAHPETALQEKMAADKLCAFLESHGFVVKRGLAKLPTSFRADAGDARARPRAAFLCEYDALPEIGHACGHSVIAASGAGAGAALHRAFPNMPVSVIGTPGEEAGIGKPALLKAGAFRGIDFALMVHPSTRRQIVRLFLGVVHRVYTFHGKSAHAAAFPHQGVNALDAVIMLYNAVAALRQQLPEQARVHSIITDGGKAPNIIPERAQALYMVRALDPAVLADLARKIDDCARGAARATGTRLKITKPAGFHPPFNVNRALSKVYEDKVQELGLEPFLGPEDKNIGSSDITNLSYALPVIHPHVPIIFGPGKIGIHTREFEKAAGGEGGREAGREGATLLALTAAHVIGRPAAFKAVQREFDSTSKRLPAGLG